MQSLLDEEGALNGIVSFRNRWYWRWIINSCIRLESVFSSALPEKEVR
jgi:hypothetical protein